MITTDYYYKSYDTDDSFSNVNIPFLFLSREFLTFHGSISWLLLLDFGTETSELFTSEIDSR